MTISDNSALPRRGNLVYRIYRPVDPILNDECANTRGFFGDWTMIELRVTGMTCGHCEAAVRKALEAVPGVTRVVQVDRNSNSAVVEGKADLEALVEAVKEEGYQASPA